MRQALFSSFAARATTVLVPTVTPSLRAFFLLHLARGSFVAFLYPRHSRAISWEFLVDLKKAHMGLFNVVNDMRVCGVWAVYVYSCSALPVRVCVRLVFCF
jgi:hypothetical protein